MDRSQTDEVYRSPKHRAFNITFTLLTCTSTFPSILPKTDSHKLYKGTLRLAEWGWRQYVITSFFRHCNFRTLTRTYMDKIKVSACDWDRTTRGILQQDNFWVRQQFQALTAIMWKRKSVSQMYWRVLHHSWQQFLNEEPSQVDESMFWQWKIVLHTCMQTLAYIKESGFI